MNKFLRLDGVTSRFGFGKSFLYERIRAGKFPTPIKLSSRFAVWPEDEVNKVYAAWAAGKNDEEIRQLVKTLLTERKELALEILDS